MEMLVVNSSKIREVVFLWLVVFYLYECEALETLNSPLFNITKAKTSTIKIYNELSKFSTSVLGLDIKLYFS